MNVTVKEATISDAPEIERLCTQLGYPIGIGQATINIQLLIESKIDMLWIAAVDQIPIGWIHVSQTLSMEYEPFCEIRGLVVDQTFYRMGVGRILIETAKSWTLATGHRVLKVRTNTRRVEAPQFYKAMGFQEKKQQTAFEIQLTPISS